MLIPPARSGASCSCTPGVSMIPGAMAFTRMPRGPSSFANACVRPMTAAFDTLYALMLAPPRRAAIDDRLMMLPPAFICRNASRAALY